MIEKSFEEERCLPTSSWNYYRNVLFKDIYVSLSWPRLKIFFSVKSFFKYHHQYHCMITGRTPKSSLLQYPLSRLNAGESSGVSAVPAGLSRCLHRSLFNLLSMSWCVHLSVLKLCLWDCQVFSLHFQKLSPFPRYRPGSRFLLGVTAAQISASTGVLLGSRVFRGHFHSALSPGLLVLLGCTGQMQEVDLGVL